MKKAILVLGLILTLAACKSVSEDASKGVDTTKTSVDSASVADSIR